MAAAAATAAAPPTVRHGQRQAGPVAASHAESDLIEEFTGVFTVADGTRGRDICQGHGPFFLKNGITL